jgi:hypothetical protein
MPELNLWWGEEEEEEKEKNRLFVVEREAS